MEQTTTIEDEGKAPGVVGIAALIGFGKAAFEGLMGIIGVAASHSLGDSFGGAMLAFGILFFLSSWLLLKGSKAGYWASVILSALGLTAAVVYLFRSSDAIFMQMAPHVQAIQGDLAAAAALGDEASTQAAQRLSQALESSLHLRILDLLTEVAADLSRQLSSGRVDVRLAGRDPELVFVEEEHEPAEAAAGTFGFAGDEIETTRITLRLPESLKLQAEGAAAREGVSTNTWLVRAVAQALEPRRPPRMRTGNRLQGFAQS